MKLSILAAVSTVTCIAAAAACGSSSGGNGFGGGGGGDSGTAGGEGGAVGDGGTGTETGGSLPYEGEITAAKDGTVFALSGAFFPTPATTPSTPTCPATGTASGSCCYLPPAATDGGVATDGGATETAASAGTITIKDGNANVAALNPLTGGGYGITGNGTNNPSVTWKPGDVLSISASGGTVEAFTGSLTTVDDFAGVTPTLSTTATTVPLASDLTISWTVGNGANVTTLLAVKSGTITCQVNDSAGTVSVPATLLGKLTTAQEGVLTLSRSGSTKVTGPNASVTLIGTTSSGGVIKTM